MESKGPRVFFVAHLWEEEYPPKKPNLSAVDLSPGPALHQWEDVADCTLCVPSIPPAVGCWRRPFGAVGVWELFNKKRLFFLLDISFLEAFERYLVLVFRLLVFCILFLGGGLFDFGFCSRLGGCSFTFPPYERGIPLIESQAIGPQTTNLMHPGLNGYISNHPRGASRQQAIDEFGHLQVRQTGPTVVPGGA